MRGWPASAVVLRAVMVLAPLGALLLAAPAGDAPSASVVAIVLVASLGFARAPESGFGLLALGSVVAWWAVVPDDGLDATVLLAAVLLVAAHVAGLLAALGPGGVRLDRGVAAVWVARASLVALAAPVVWLVARLAGDVAPDAALWQAGLALALLAVVAGGVGLGVGRDTT